MTITYPHDRPAPQDTLDNTREEPFIPVYARNGRSARGGKKSGVKTWMILAPVGVLALGGITAALVLGGEEPAPVPLAEPAATAPVLPAQPLLDETVTTEAAPVAPIVEPAPAPTPRRADPAPARRTAPVRAATPDPVVEEPVAPTGPQPYTSALNTAPPAPATTPAPSAPAPAPASPPVIVIEPAG